MFRLAHLSDPHLGPLPKPKLRELASKRLTGYMNWRRGRSRSHDMALLARILDDIHALTPDHIACTGDLVNIGLHGEFPGAVRFMKQLGLPTEVSFVPGNHDAYVRTNTADIERYLAPWMTSDSGRYEGFPYVRLVGPIAIVGLSSAVPTAPFMASGTLGPEQREKLANILGFLATQPQARVVLIHHPPHRQGAQPGRGLTDAKRVEDIIGKYGAELLLHGHNHVLSVDFMDGPKGRVPVVGAPSASAIGGTITHRAGWNLFEFDMTEHGVTITGTARGLLKDGSIGIIKKLELAEAVTA